MTVVAGAYKRLRPGVRKKVDALVRLNPDYTGWVANASAGNRDQVAVAKAGCGDGHHLQGERMRSLLIIGVDGERAFRVSLSSSTTRTRSGSFGDSDSTILSPIESGR